jgi:hypothetical protein
MKDKAHYETQASRALDLLERALDHLEADHGGKHAAKLNTNAPLITALSQAGLAFLHAAEYALTDEVFGPPNTVNQVMKRLDLPPVDENLRPVRLEPADPWGRPRCQKITAYTDTQEPVQCALEAGHPGDCDTLPNPPAEPEHWSPGPATGYPPARGWRAEE